ncbi:MAG TPA: FmdB family zinc ribbon protein [Terracidiphilus sp.]|nr:FmdB family zinc ribbon protein [Terracidiphilus sp.]
MYEYRCTQCGYRFEKIQPFSAEPESECPKCQGPLVRPLTAPAFQFKGAGWYVNDYASRSAPASESAPESKSGGDSTKAAPAGESKPAESKGSESKSSESKSAPASTSDSGSTKPGSAA